MIIPHTAANSLQLLMCSKILVKWSQLIIVDVKPSDLDDHFLFVCTCTSLFKIRTWMYDSYVEACNYVRKYKLI